MWDQFHFIVKFRISSVELNEIGCCCVERIILWICWPFSQRAKVDFRANDRWAVWWFYVVAVSNFFILLIVNFVSVKLNDKWQIEEKIFKPQYYFSGDIDLLSPGLLKPNYCKKQRFYYHFGGVQIRSKMAMALNR